jgi:hypothetical protein
MHEFVRRSAPRTPQRKAARAARRQGQERERHRQAAQRTQLLQPRQQEDTAWQAVRAARHARLRPAQWTPRLWAD